MWRNLTDETIKAVADRGGVVGVIFAPQFIGGKTLAHVAKHIEHAVNVMGEDGVALGSDFDGMIPLPQGMRDVRDLPKLTQVLVDRGLPVRVVEKVLGEQLPPLLRRAAALTSARHARPLLLVVRLATGAAPGFLVTPCVDEVTVRDAPGVAGKRLGAVPRGAPLEVLRASPPKPSR